MHASASSLPRSLSLNHPPSGFLQRGITAAVDLDAPLRGIVSGENQLLGLDLRSPCGAVDHWLRGGDVVAVYEPNDPRQLRATALWRKRPAPQAAAWELITSATTAREQSDTSLAVVSRAAASGMLWGVAVGDTLRWQTDPPINATAACVLLRRDPHADSESLLVAGHPADVRRLVVHQEGGRARIECWLFSSAAEKGVLFRGRVLAAIGPRSGDTEWAAAIWADFAASPPMLTT